MLRVAIGGLAALIFCLMSSSGFAKADHVQATSPHTQDARLAVLAFRPKPETFAHWQPLVEYLNATVPGTRFRLEVYTYPELEQVVAQGKVEFLLTQPSHYVLLTYRNSLSSPLATLVGKEGAFALSKFGGVIFTRQDRTDINTLGDLRGKRLAASAVSSLGSYQMQALELAHAGIHLPEDAQIEETGQPQDKAVEGVLAGKFDAGFVRTGVIEAMHREGRLDPQRLKLINARREPGFPYALSTRLYSEWPLAAMPNVAPDLARRVAAALLALPHDGALARRLRIEGFTIPGDYRPIDALLRELRLPPFDTAPEFTWRDIWQRYQGGIAIAATAGSLLLLLAVMGLYTANRRLKNEVSERLRIESELRKLSLAVEQSPESIIITDTHACIEYVNDAFVNKTGYSREEIIGKNSRILQSGKTPRAKYDEMWAHLSQGESWQGEYINKRKDGGEFIESVRVAPVRQADGRITHYIAIKEDVTQRKLNEERIHYLAHFDTLTGLPNRAQLDDHLNYALTLAKRSNGHLALMFLDLDRFKDINDTLGHSVGDALLIEVAQRMRSLLREEDTVSRLGGDEFILMLPGTDERGAALVAQKLLDVVSQPFRIAPYDLTVTASIGIALYPNDGEDLEALSRSADAAMYRVKREGRHGYHFFTAEIQAHSARHLLLVNALRQALELQQLQVHYQPQISLSNGQVVGAEALLRWHHPELGDISPLEFIPAAEDSGLILPIGEWVLRQALKQVRSWQEAGLPPLVMAVNLSAVQFRHPDLPDLVARVLTETALPARFLELELTESVAMSAPQGAIETMNRLDEQGVRMSIDDFGTGYSSLSYLKKFKVYKLKIDQSFVRDISTDPEDKAIVGAIISMARSLGLQTLAEGVETMQQLQFLQERGCNEVQGYHYSKALPPHEFAAFVQARSVAG